MKTAKDIKKLSDEYNSLEGRTGRLVNTIERAAKNGDTMLEIPYGLEEDLKKEMLDLKFKVENYEHSSCFRKAVRVSWGD